MLTLYTVVKGFEGEFAHIQRNAINSWMHTLPGAEVVLFGDDEKWAIEEAEERGLPILPMVRTEGGAPFLPDIIRSAHGSARYDVRMLINADIILEPGIVQAVQVVDDLFDDFLLVSWRWGATVDYEIDFEDEDWHAKLLELPWQRGRVDAADFFCYRGDLMDEMPDFGMGRTAWDNWIITQARRKRIPIVDGSELSRALHQDHAKTASKQALADKKNKVLAEEVARNRRLFNSLVKRVATLQDVTHYLDKDGTLRERIAR